MKYLNPLTNAKIKKFIDKINKSELELCGGYDKYSRNSAYLYANMYGKSTDRAICIVDCTPSDVRYNCFLSYPKDLTDYEFDDMCAFCPRGYSLFKPESEDRCIEMKKV
jgi:hypothetical protein